MIPPPVPLGLTLCESLMVEEKSRKVSLIRILARLTADHFPYTPPPFFAFASLTDGLGDATIELVVSHLDGTDEIFIHRRQTRFSSKLQEVQLVFRVADFSFPEPGSYQVTLLIDGESVVERRLRVVLTNEEE